MVEQLPDISVVVCTYSPHRSHDLLHAIASVRGQALKPREIIVVVDQSEELGQSLRAILPPDVILVLNAGPRGLSSARNTGVRAARGEIVAFLDDDAWAEPDWLGQLTAVFRQPNVLGVGGQILPNWPELRRPSWFPRELDWVVGCSYAGLPLSSDQRVRNVIGCNMAFRRSVFDGAGYFRITMGRVGKTTGQAEDTDFCLRVLDAFPNAIILYEPRAVVHHRVTPERATMRFLLTRSYNEGYWKGRMQRLQAKRPGGVLSSERLYLRHLLTRFVPDRLSRIHEAHSLAKLGTVLLTVTAVGVGYLAAGLVRGGSHQ
jgi:GT2 family glycosyltransferase